MKYLLVILAFLLAGCVAQEKFYVTKVNELSYPDQNRSVYALPKTILYISVYATKTTVIPGPFHSYADKYLGIKNVPDSSTVEWAISNVDIGSYNEADPDYFFAIKKENVKTLDRKLSRLVDDSLILCPDRLFERHMFYEQDNISGKNVYYTDLSVKRNIDIKTDTSYKEIFKDSTYIKIPVLRKQYVNKSLKDKAEEAANFIIKIRKRRFKLISGQYDFMPDGDAMAVAIDELNKLESEYLSLFTGKKQIGNFIKTMQYIPENTRKESKEILFRFSLTDGFIDREDVRGRPVFIEVDDLDRSIGIKDSDNTEKVTVCENSFFIRLPDLANIRLVFDKGIIIETQVPVFQFGSLMLYSVNGE